MPELHIVGENERVLAGVLALENGQLDKFGQLMFQSHGSSTRNFENSTSFLDALVEIAATIEAFLARGSPAEALVAPQFGWLRRTKHRKS